jgi:hypothetical protein
MDSVAVTRSAILMSQMGFTSVVVMHLMEDSGTSFGNSLYAELTSRNISVS